MSKSRKRQPKLLVPHRYRVRQAIYPATTSAEAEDDSVYSLATGRWTRGSRLSSFIDGELGSTLGRWMRAGGRLVIDPIDNLIGTREVKRLEDYLDGLDYYGWLTLKDHFDAEGYAPRLVEVLRYPVYPRSLRLRAQRITLKLAILGQIRFDQVKPRIHFHSKDEFEESITDLCDTAISLIPKHKLLAVIPASEDDLDGFLSSLRREVSSAASAKEWRWPIDDRILFKLAQHCYNKGSWSEAEESFLRATEARKQLLGEGHCDTLESVTWLASTYWRQGRWKEAEDHQLQVLEKWKRAMGEDHCDTLTSMNSLAATYRSQGRWKEAEHLGLEVLEKRKRVLGEGHPKTLSSMNILALTYRDQCRWEEAENRQLVYERDRRVLREFYPDALNSMSDLGSPYRDQGRLKEAEEMALTALRKRNQVLGREHPRTLFTMALLARIYKKQDRLKEAEDLEVQALQLMRRVLGDEHPHTVDSIWDLATTYRMQERHEEANNLGMELTMHADNRV